jgi:hypothetical protein
MGIKIWVAVISALSLLYVFLLFGRGLILIQEPSLAAKAMGVGILVLPLFAFWSIFSELRFGMQAQKLAERLQTEGFPELALEFRPSGRATEESAAREFERVSAELNQTETWQLWFQLGQSYDANGDRRRARAAIRKAILLANNPDAPKS